MKLSLGLLLAVVFASSSFAQNAPDIEGSFGYSFLRQQVGFDRHGWVASAAGNVNNWFGVKGEAGGSYTDIPHNDSHSFLAGAQFTARIRPAVSPWLHFLAGVVRTQQGVSPFLFASVLTTESDFAMQPGVGVDFWMRPKFGIRLGGDYRRVFFDRPDVNRDHIRLHVGIVFRTSPR